MASSAGKTMDFAHAICRIVEDTSGHERLKYFGPGCLVKFENTEFLNSVGTPRSNYFLVASSQVLRKDLLGTLQRKSELSVVMIAEFQCPGVRGKLERKPLNELYSSLEDDVFEQAGIIYVSLTKLRASRFRSRALDGRFSLMTSDELRCIVLCNDRTINREQRDMGEVSTKVYDLRQIDQGAYMFHWSRFPNYCLRNEVEKVFTTEDEFQSFDGEPLGSIILTRDAKFVGVLNFIEKQPAPAFVGSGFGTAASVRHDIPEREIHAGASGGSYPLLDPELKSELESETEIWKVTAEPAATPLTRNHFDVVVNGEGELQEKKGAASHDSVKPVSMASGSQLRPLIDQISEQDATWQQVPPAAAAAHKNVSESTFIQEIISPSAEKLSVNERKRKRQCHDHNQQENVDLDQLLLDVTSVEDGLEQSEDILKDIHPNKGSIKGGDRFYLTLGDFVPVEIESFKAIFQGGEEVYLEKADPFILTGKIPGSKYGPGNVRVTLMSSDESWCGGGCDFLYIGDPPLQEEFLNMILRNRGMWDKLFDRMDKEMSFSKPSDGQTSDSSGKTNQNGRVMERRQVKKTKL